MLRKRISIGFVVIVSILTITIALAAAQGSNLLNAYQSLYYYSLRIDERFPTIDPLATTIQELEKEIRSGFRSDEAWLVLGLVHQANGQIDQALAAFTQANSSTEDSGSLAILMADIYFHQSNSDAASRLYEQALEVEEYARAHYGLGLIDLDQNAWDQAQTRFTAALELAEDYLDARIGLGIALYHAGQSEQAAEVLEIALQQDSRSIAANAAIAEVYDSLEEWEKAAHARQRVDELRGEPQH